jgi:hypothetical protein
MFELTTSAKMVLLDIRNKGREYEEEKLYIRFSIGNC